jgi:hypothetical protein
VQHVDLLFECHAADDAVYLLLVAEQRALGGLRMGCWAADDSDCREQYASKMFHIYHSFIRFVFEVFVAKIQISERIAKQITIYFLISE